MRGGRYLWCVARLTQRLTLMTRSLTRSFDDEKVDDEKVDDEEVEA